MIILKITEELLDEIHSDLKRTHPHAAERVGFISVRTVAFPENTLLLAVAHYPVPDEQYIDDPFSGARINSQAIRGAMQLTLDTGEGIFHIHSHYGKNIPGFSGMDRKEMPPIVRSLQATNSDASHGMIVLNEENAFGLVQLSNEDDLRPINKIVIVGSPTKII